MLPIIPAALSFLGNFFGGGGDKDKTPATPPAPPKPTVNPLVWVFSGVAALIAIVAFGALAFRSRSA